MKCKLATFIAVLVLALGGIPGLVHAQENRTRSIFGDLYALQELKSDVIDLEFQPRMPARVMESRNALSQVEVAQSR